MCVCVFFVCLLQKAKIFEANNPWEMNMTIKLCKYILCIFFPNLNKVTRAKRIAMKRISSWSFFPPCYMNVNVIDSKQMWHETFFCVPIIISVILGLQSLI